METRRFFSRNPPSLTDACVAQVAELSRHYNINLLETPGGRAYSYTQDTGLYLGHAVCARRELLRLLPHVDTSVFSPDECSSNPDELATQIRKTTAMA